MENAEFNTQNLRLGVQAFTVLLGLFIVLSGQLIFGVALITPALLIDICTKDLKQDRDKNLLHALLLFEAITIWIIFIVITSSQPADLKSQDVMMNRIHNVITKTVTHRTVEESKLGAEPLNRLISRSLRKPLNNHKNSSNYNHVEIKLNNDTIPKVNKIDNEIVKNPSKLEQHDSLKFLSRNFSIEGLEYPTSNGYHQYLLDTNIISAYKPGNYKVSECIITHL